MARFYDYAKRVGDKWKDRDLLQQFGGATVIDASNLSDYMYANEAKGEWDLVNDFFNLAPPFERFFVECRAPKELLTAKGMVPWPKHLPQQWGVLFMASELDKMSDIERWRLPSAVIFDKKDGQSTENVKWVVQAILFADGGYVPGFIRPQFSWWFPVKADGSQPMSPTPRDRHMQIEYAKTDGMPEPKYTEDPNRPGHGQMEMDADLFKLVTVKAVDAGTRFWYPNDKAVELNKQLPDDVWESLKQEKTDCYIQVLSLAEDMFKMTPPWQMHYTMVEEQYWLPLLQPCLMSICFLHCKNIEMERVDIPEKVQKRAVKKHGEPLVNYHVLKIQPFKKVLESEGHVGETGIRRALHLCRGHFHHYGPEFGRGKLFGKFTGTFWVPAHLRGTTDSGMMDKTYKVTPPEAAAG